jgi:large subunit ribosomal protein L43
VTIKFSKTGGSSKGIRDIIETEIVDFSRKNPGIVVYLKPRMKPTPVMVCEYLNGTRHWQILHKFGRDEIMAWLDYYVTRSGDPVKRYRKPCHTDWPSVQGVWNPFLNIPTALNVTPFPVPGRSQVLPQKVTATEQLLEMVSEGSQKALIIEQHRREHEHDP